MTNANAPAIPAEFIRIHTPGKFESYSNVATAWAEYRAAREAYGRKDAQLVVIDPRYGVWINVGKLRDLRQYAEAVRVAREVRD